jgi:hypothetical protein
MGLARQQPQAKGAFQDGNYACDRSESVVWQVSMTRLTRKRYDGHARLYGTQEAAKYLGITRRNLTYMLANDKVIEPLARLACGPIWSESQLDEQLFAWRNDMPIRYDNARIRQMTIARRLGVLEDRWQALVRAAAKDDTREIIAVWEGRQARRMHKQGRSAHATFPEARRALAEAKLLRLIADLGDEDPVFAGIAAELEEAADLRKTFKSIKKARAKRAAVAETVNAHEDV